MLHHNQSFFNPFVTKTYLNKKGFVSFGNNNTFYGYKNGNKYQIVVGGIGWTIYFCATEMTSEKILFRGDIKTKIELDTILKLTNIIK
jgi:hypothetical protein